MLSAPRKAWLGVALLLGLGVSAPAAVHGQEGGGTPAAAVQERSGGIFEKRQPATVADLREIQDHVVGLVERVMPAVVAVRVGSSQGSGVIVGDEGYVLTAGHVIGRPDRDAQIILHDGRKLKARTLGINRDIDSGLLKITEAGEWASLEMAAGETAAGQWCLSLGHPGGLIEGRPPVVRLGRVLFSNDKAVCTDCALVGGDSGGPLFDMEGHVLGIHSRIGWQVTTNFHVPVKTYRESWDRLAAGELWGGAKDTRTVARPLLGVVGDAQAKPCKIQKVEPGSPAEKAGVQVDDVIHKVDGEDVGSFAELLKLIERRKPGQRVLLELLRDDQTIELPLVLGEAR